MAERPLRYRVEIVGAILRSVVAGECCSVVGTSGVGKSNVIGQLLRPDVHREHAGAEADALRLVLLDSNMLIALTPACLFAQIVAELRRLLDINEGPATTVAPPCVDDYGAALAGCARVLDELCERWRIVLLLDEFDPLFAALPGRALRNLRALRDRHKYRLTYVTFSRQPLASLRDTADWEESEAFVELLTLREFGLGPLSAGDALDETHRIGARLGGDLPDSARQAVVRLSGGHPALLRALVHLAVERPQHFAGPAEPAPLTPELRAECAKIWQQLTGAEQDGLARALIGDFADERALHTLLLKGLLHPAPRPTTLFSPLFADYLRAWTAPATPASPAAFAVDTGHRLISYYGRDISADLTLYERRMLIKLWEQRGAICSYEELARAVYPDVSIDDLDSLKAVARRLRRKLDEIMPTHPVPIQVYPGLGLRLALLTA